ncbi:MAG: MBL fold metallo-hydrolase [Myxococcales bacterium]
MEVRFWGVRGSIAAPGPSTLRTGGNTSCVEINWLDHFKEGQRQRLMLDAGTGIRSAGAALASTSAPESPLEITLCLSHLHWDHIQGLPFFAPLYRANTRLTIYGPGASDSELENALMTQMGAPGFPVPWHALPAQIHLQALRGGERFQVGEAEVTCRALNHPGGVLAYRIDQANQSVVYATDTEHGAEMDETLLSLAEGADALIYDAMYTEAEYRGTPGRPPRVGWGHSTWQAGAQVAHAARVGRYVLFHHDPVRDDAQVDALESAAREVFPGTLAAREGLALSLGRDPERRVA